MLTGITPHPATGTSLFSAKVKVLPGGVAKFPSFHPSTTTPFTNNTTVLAAAMPSTYKKDKPW